MTTPFFTVFMAVWNAEPFIGRAIVSVLLQDFEDFELVIADDASSLDRTWDIIQDSAVKDSRIRPWRSSTRREGLANYLELYPTMRGEVVVELDGDDFFCVPHALSRIRACYDDPEVDGTFCSVGAIVEEVVVPPRGLRMAKDAPWLYWAVRSWRRSLTAAAPSESYIDPETSKPWMWPRDAALYCPVVVHGRRLVHVGEHIHTIGYDNPRRTPLIVGAPEMYRKGHMIGDYWREQERLIYGASETS